LKLRIGITGQSGFIGTHLFNTLGLYPDRYTRIPFEDAFFESKDKLETFAGKCDVIVHLTAMNRHGDPGVIYDTNTLLVRQLIDACEKTHSTPHILFSSSTQEERDNPYGKSKREGREMFEAWANRNNAQFSAFVIPNVYGPFGHPYYNSVVATFCHQLTHREQPRIDTDSDLKLIYVAEVVKHFIDQMELVRDRHRHDVVIETIKIGHTAGLKVSALLRMLVTISDNYVATGEIPALDTPFKRNLFNTFVCYIDHAGFYPCPLKLKTDQRGGFVETVKTGSGGQMSFSTTVPGITRGNHFHTRKIERFAVIKGEATIQLRRIGTDEVMEFHLSGEKPAYVDMPIWYTHNITNTGNEELYTIFWINEFFNPADPDTWFEKVQ